MLLLIYPGTIKNILSILKIRIREINDLLRHKTIGGRFGIRIQVSSQEQVCLNDHVLRSQRSCVQRDCHVLFRLLKGSLRGQGLPSEIWLGVKALLIPPFLWACSPPFSSASSCESGAAAGRRCWVGVGVLWGIQWGWDSFWCPGRYAWQLWA